MKVAIEEIVRSNEGGYERSVWTLDPMEMSSAMIHDLGPGEELWLEPVGRRNPVPTERRKVLILCSRNVAIDDQDEIGLLIDVCADYIRAEIGEGIYGEAQRLNPISERQYIAWATENKVWP